MTIDFSQLYKCFNAVYWNALFNKKKQKNSDTPIKLETGYNVEIFYGGGGAGKSEAIAARDLYNLFTQKDFRHCVFRKVGATIKYSTFFLYQKILNRWGLREFVKVNKQECSIFYGDNYIISRGIDDIEKAKSMEATSGWIEEASEASEEEYNQIKIRMRGGTLTLSFNPISKEHWLKKRFFDREEPDTFVLHTTYKDNRFLSAQGRKDLEYLKEVDENYYNIYCLGHWGSINKGLIFSNFTQQKIKYSIDDYDEVLRGIDFGFNHASTFMTVGLKDDVVYIHDEVYVKGYTNSEFLPLINDSLGNNWATADCAEPDRIEEFRQHGLKIKESKKGKGSVKSGIDWIKAHKVVINEHCVNTLREFQNYKYKTVKISGTEITTDEPVSVNDDCIAGIRYAIEEKWHNAMATAKAGFSFAR